MTRRDALQCVHEPFGDAFYYGPEHMSERYKNDAAGREASGLSKSTYDDILTHIEDESTKEVRLLLSNDSCDIPATPQVRLGTD